jgi:hypothetical protein
MNSLMVREEMADGQKGHYSRVWLATGSGSPEIGEEAGALRKARSGQVFGTAGAWQWLENGRN